MTQKFKHIAIVGKMHSGKSTLARFLVYDHGYTRVGLSDDVKQEAANLLGIRVEEIEANKALFRPFLQWFGTEWVREYKGKPDFWIRRFIWKVDQADGPVVCDDVRFVNEAEALWGAGFMVVRVVRPEADRLASSGAQGIAGHASEMEQDGIMPYLTVPNDGDLEQLRHYAEKVVEIMEDPEGWKPRPDVKPGEVHRVAVSRK